MKKKFLILILGLIGFTAVFAQNQEQAKGFVNKSIHAINKLQKELAYRKNNTFNSDLKGIFVNQIMAVELFKKNDFKQALNYSYSAREKAMELIAKIGVVIPKETLMEPSEALFFKKNDTFIPKPVLSNSATNQLNQCDVLNYAQTSQLTLFIL
jgi:hypothetical protein